MFLLSLRENRKTVFQTNFEYFLIFCCTHSKLWWTVWESNPLTAILQGLPVTHNTARITSRSDQSILRLDKLGAETATPPPAFTKTGKSYRINFVCICEHLIAELILNFGPDTRIRTLDLLIPNQARYQTALHPDILYCGIILTAM